MRQPTQDQAIGPDHLRAIDAHVVACDGFRFAPLWTRDDDGPGDERPGIPRPRGLHRQRAKIERSLNRLGGRAAQDLGPRCKCGLQHRPARQRIAHARDGRRAPQRGQEFAQCVHTLLSHTEAGGHAGRRAEEIGDHRHLRPHALPISCVAKPQDRPPLTQGGKLNGRHLVPDRDRLADIGDVSLLFAPAEEGAQIFENRQGTHGTSGTGKAVLTPRPGARFD